MRCDEGNKSVGEVAVELFCIFVLELRENEPLAFSVIENPSCVTCFIFRVLGYQVFVWVVPRTTLLELECGFRQVTAVIVSQQGLTHAHVVRFPVGVKLSVLGLIWAASQADKLVKT